MAHTDIRANFHHQSLEGWWRPDAYFAVHTPRHLTVSYLLSKTILIPNKVNNIYKQLNTTANNMQTWIEYYCALQSYSSLHCGALSLWLKMLLLITSRAWRGCAGLIIIDFTFKRIILPPPDGLPPFWDCNTELVFLICLSPLWTHKKQAVQCLPYRDNVC